MDKKYVSLLLAVLMFFISSGIFAFENKHKIELTIGEKNITIEGKPGIIESEPIEKDGKIYIDINILKHLKGIDVSYDQATKKISISQERPKVFLNGGEKNELISLIKTSKIIYIEMYQLTNNEIIEALRQRAYGIDDVSIRIILDTNEEANLCYYKKINTEQYLENKDRCIIRWRWGRSEKNNKYFHMHRKVALFIDNLGNMTTYLGSTNWTDNALNNKNWEIGILFQDRELGLQIKEEFLEFWKDNKKSLDVRVKQ